MCYRLITLVTLLFAFGKIQAQQQTPYTRIARIMVDSGQLDTYLSFLKESIETAVKKEPGVLGMHAVADKAHAHRITIMETYASKSAYDRHIQTAHFKKYKQATLSMVKSLELTDVVPIIHIIK